DQHGEHGKSDHGEAYEALASHRALLRGELPLFGLMSELKRDQHALEGPEQYERQDDGERAPQRRVQPIRRRIENLHDEREANHDESRDQDHEHGRPIARISEAVVEHANIASWGECGGTSEERAREAGGTRPGE